MAERLKNLAYGFAGNVERGLLDRAIKEMDSVSRLIPPQGSWMSPNAMLRTIKFRDNPIRYYVRDIQDGGPNGKSEVSGEYVFEDGKCRKIE